MLLAWLSASGAIYGGGLYAAAHGAGDDVPEARVDCDAPCVGGWVAALTPETRAAYLRFQGADALHAVLGAGLLALASLRLARRSRLPRSLAALAPAVLASSEVLENAALAALAAGATLPALAPAIVELRACKFVALGASLAVVGALALGAAWRGLRRRLQEGVR
jgi:hypothetical protein